MLPRREQGIGDLTCDYRMSGMGKFFILYSKSYETKRRAFY